MTYALAYITTKDREEARAIGSALLTKRLAACVNILDGMESHYWWEGKLEASQEAVLIAKTESAKVEPLIATVKALHSYSCPCVLVLPVTAGNPAYLDWLGESLRGK